MGFLIIIPIALYMLVFIPAFMFAWEGSVDRYLGCSGWVCVILGFPGVLLASVIKLIVKMFEYPIEKKRQERIAEEEQRQAQQHAENIRKLEQKVAFLFERIKDELIADSYDRPSKIMLYHNGIGLFEGDALIKKIAFSSYDLDNLSLYEFWWCTDGTHGNKDFNELNYLAELIKTHFHNQYIINDKNMHQESQVESYKEWHTLHSCQQSHVEMYIINPHISHDVATAEVNKDHQKIYAKYGVESRVSLPTPAKSSPFKSKYITSYNEYFNTLTNLYLKGGKKQLSDAEILQFIRDYDLDRRFGIRIEDVKADLSNIESTYK